LNKRGVVAGQVKS